MLLSELVEKISTTTHFSIEGYDAYCNKYWSIWSGYKWQCIIGGVIEDCEVISIVCAWSDDEIKILVDAEYDNYRGMK